MPEPKYDYYAGFFAITFMKSVNGKLNGELNKHQQTVFNAFKTFPGINASELSSKLEIPFSTINKYIRIFLRNEIIERKGSKKTGGYFTKTKKN